jgi:predicted dehydrogenase
VVDGGPYGGGIQWIDFMASMGMRVRRVVGHRPAGANLERSMLVTFEYEEGAVGTLAYSWEVPSTAKGLRLSKIYGRAGTITFETNGLWVRPHGTKTRFYVPGLRDLAGYRAMWADFVRAWKTGEPPRMTLAQARRDLELVEAAYATAAEVL